MSTLTTQEKADRLINRVFKKLEPMGQPSDHEGGPPEPKSNILRSLNRSRRRLDAMKKGL